MSIFLGAYIGGTEMTDRDEVIKKCFKDEKIDFEGEFVEEESYNKEGRLVDLKALEAIVKDGVARYKKKCEEAIANAKKSENKT
jgi:hypothetical protein